MPSQTHGHSATGYEGSQSPRYCYDSSLLFRCMEMLRVDRDDFAQADPLLFRELQGRCALCRVKETCVQDLASRFDDDLWDKWQAYCPNSATLRTVGAMQNCGRAAQYLKIAQASLASEVG